MKTFEEWFKDWEEVQPDKKLPFDCHEGAEAAWLYLEDFVCGEVFLVYSFRGTTDKVFGDEQEAHNWMEAQDSPENYYVEEWEVVRHEQTTS